LIGCNDSATTSEKKDNDTTTALTNSDTSSMPAYDAAMDPLTVEASFAKKLGDTLNIKIYELTFKPGDSALLLSHPDFTMYVVQGGKLAISPQGADRQVIDLKAGMGIIFGSVTHSGKNVGNTTIKLLINDIYRPRGK
jgi:hypothetical protein